MPKSPCFHTLRKPVKSTDDLTPSGFRAWCLDRGLRVWMPPASLFCVC